MTNLLADCASHYPAWRDEFPSAAARFTPGAFGENLVFKHMNERNVCIGDVFAIGDGGAMLQVSLPRQPCFKLNHRFQLKNFAPNTYKLSRTGWYYRCLAEGIVKGGDSVVLKERPWPKWTIERVQEYLHRNVNDHAANEELAGIEELGVEARKAFEKRVKQHTAKAESGKKQGTVWRKYSIVEKKTLTPRITSFILTTNTPLTESDKLEEGTHATIRLSNGLVRSYSIVSGTKSSFELGIALDEHSRGGSRFLHESTSTGSSIEVSGFSDPMPVATAAAHHLFIVGGIGITAFLPIFEAMHAIHFSFNVHWAVRSEADAPFQDRLAPFRHCVALYSKEKGQRLDVPAVLERRPWGTHVYVCGPDRLVDGVRGAVESAGIESGDVHYELFKIDASGDPFEVLVKNREGKLVQVGGEESLLEALRKVFDGVESSCEVGNCGTCRISVVEGRVEHRGVGLPESEKQEAMLSCVSRGVGRIVVEI